MRKRVLFTCLALWCFFFWGAKKPSYDENCQAFVRKHLHLVKKYCLPAGVPASVALALSIRESAAGQSKLAREANNYFGIKADARRWSGPCYLKTDDEYDRYGNLICSKFRRYPSAAHSFADFPKFLRSGKNYAPLFDLDPTDYAGWARGLKKAGYATNPRFAQELIATIERYDLQRFDRPERAGEGAVARSGAAISDNEKMRLLIPHNPGDGVAEKPKKQVAKHRVVVK